MPQTLKTQKNNKDEIMNNVNLEKFQENGYTYIRLYISCPVCLDNHRTTPHKYWAHHNCGGDIYVGDNAHYKCTKCGQANHVQKWGYNCPSHTNSLDEFVGASCQALASAIATAGQMTTALGVAWLQRFLANLESSGEQIGCVR